MLCSSDMILRRIRRICWFALLVAADQGSKYLAWRFLRTGGPLVLCKGVFELHYLQNNGAAFGMLRGRQWIFILFAAAILIAAFWFGGRLSGLGKRFLPLQICTTLLAAGAAGNMIDRIIHEYVIDFIYFSLIHFPVFNLADVYVSVGCALFLILILFVYKEEDLNRIAGKKTHREYVEEITRKIRETKGQDQNRE